MAGPAAATWIEGKVFCDDGDGGFDGGDTPLNGVLLKAVGGNCTASPANCTDTTGDAVPVSPAVAGYYRIVLPHVSADIDTMIVSGLPGNAMVINPSDGVCEKHVEVDTGDASNARKTCNFLVSPCVSPTTSTSSSTTSTSSSTSSTSNPPPTTSTSSPPPTTSSTTSTSSSTIRTTSTSSSSSSSTTVTSTTSTTRVTTPLEFCEETVDHLKCYRTRRSVSFTPNGVTLDDQFETSDMTVLRPYRLCNPVDKNDEGIVDPAEHQMCYQIRDTTAQARFRRKDVLVENQFGKQTLVATRPETLCVPAEKDLVVSNDNGDRMKCYRVVQKVGERDFEPIVVSLEDQFESKQTVVLKPALLCNPTSVDGSTIGSPTCHQVCYKIEDAEGEPDFVPVPVQVRDEFYDRTFNPFRGECRQISLLCVPSLKTELD
jgi:hypothetical protein